jgi:heavy metal efflux system protein
MLIGPVMLLVIVPALQSYFLGRETAPESSRPEPETE